MVDRRVRRLVTSFAYFRFKLVAASINKSALKMVGGIRHGQKKGDCLPKKLLLTEGKEVVGQAASSESLAHVPLRLGHERRLTTQSGRLAKISLLGRHKKGIRMYWARQDYYCDETARHKRYRRLEWDTKDSPTAGCDRPTRAAPGTVKLPVTGLKTVPDGCGGPLRCVFGGELHLSFFPGQRQ
jgi:hypothetical protein